MMPFLTGTVFFILGAILASFALVVSERLSTGQSFVSGRSRCDFCGKPIRTASLIPVFSFIISRGKTSCCGSRLSYLYPLSEAVLGVLFVLSYHIFGFSLALFFFLIALVLLLVLVHYDIRHTILPAYPLVAFLIASALSSFFANGFSIFAISFAMGIGIAIFLILIYVLSRGRAIGFADAPLAFGLSLLVGSQAIAGFAFSFWIGAVVGIIVLLRRPKGRRMKVEVPFAPFLAAGFILAFFTQWNPFLIHFW